MAEERIPPRSQYCKNKFADLTFFSPEVTVAPAMTNNIDDILGGITKAKRTIPVNKVVIGPSKKTPVAAAAVEETPVEETPAAPVEETPVAEAPVEETPVAEAPAAPVEETLVAEAPPPRAAPVEETPVAESPPPRAAVLPIGLAPSPPHALLPVMTPTTPVARHPGADAFDAWRATEQGRRMTTLIGVAPDRLPIVLRARIEAAFLAGFSSGEL